MNQPTGNPRNWCARLLIGAVLFINVQCALLFLIQPAAYSPGFELSGAVGEATLRGIGLLFLMWNVPYAVALVDPLKYRISLFEAITMQAVGLTGETLLFIGLPDGHPALEATIMRFIIFDAGGLAALLLAAWVTRKAGEIRQ